MKMKRRDPAREEAALCRFLEKVIEFVRTIAIERGKELPHTISTIRACSVDEFDDFSICVETELDTGENNIKIWYQPSPQSSRLDPVLELRYRSSDVKAFKLCRIESLDVWGQRLQYVIRHRIFIGNRIDREHIELMRKKRRKEAAHRLSQHR